MWLLGFVALGACTDVGPTRLQSSALPITPDYKAKMAGWAKNYFAEPTSLRATRITEPVPIKVSPGIEAWLVCAEVDARMKDADYMGPRMFAFGFYGPTMSAPLERTVLRLQEEDCRRFPLVWKKWPELENAAVGWLKVSLAAH